MLLQLSISNFTLIDQIRIEFDRGLNVLTGETGAGKSILIDALQAALGERMDAASVRDKNEACIFEVVFLPPAEILKRQPVIASFLTDGDECVILRREITPEGRSKCYINQKFVNLSSLKEVGKWLVDIHGQHDHQEIFDPQSHLELVDAMAKRGEEKNPRNLYSEVYERYAALLSQKQKMTENAQGKEREIDLLSFQIQEIEKVDPKPGEENALKEERIRLVHAEKLHHLTSKILDHLDENDFSVSNQLRAFYRDLVEWSRIDPTAETFKVETDQIQLSTEELIRSVRDYQEKLEFDQGRLEEIDTRLEQLEWIGRKYRSNFEALQNFLKEAKTSLDQLAHSDLYQKEVDDQIQALLPELRKKAQSLSRIRATACEDLAKAVLKDLKDLGIRHAQFECKITETEYAPHGRERIEFLFSPNAGEPLRPLALIASGGEASRIMLAIKHALSKVDFIPTLIFDEIDANVGGRLGSCVGEKLREIGYERQVILITHLPQIASFADRHIKVRKHIEGGRTRVRYEPLSKEARIQELAQMMSGEKETEISKAHAKEMLKTAAR